MRPNKSNILIVDDTPHNLHLLSTTLTEQGYEVRGVINGLMALRVARSAHPDLILLDIKMPDISGYEVCEQLKADATTQHIPVIFLSSLDEAIDKIKAFAVGGADYITKPFQIAEVIARIENQLAIQAAQAEVRQLNQELEHRVQQRTLQLEQINQELQQEMRVRQRAESELQQTHRELTFHVENTPLAVIRWDHDLRVQQWSSQAENLFGWTAEEVIGKLAEDWPFIYEPDKQQVAALRQQMLENGEPRNVCINRNYTKSGQLVEAEWYNSAFLDDAGNLISILSLVMDVTDRRQAERALKESEERFRLIADHMSDLVCLHDPNGDYLYLSPSCQALLGYSSEELIGRNPSPMYHPMDVERIHVEAYLPLSRGEAVTTSYRMRRKSGEYIWLETVAKPILNDQKAVTQIVTASRDVTARVRAEQQLSYDALHDTLTDLPNRTLFMERTEQALRNAKRHENYRFAVLFLDLDRFKLVNDSLGHLIGDQLLVAIARLLEDCLRAIDTVARLGGDEFTILLDDIHDVTDATRVAERIQQQLKQPFLCEGHAITISASIGIVMNSEDYREATDLLRDADIAMYRAKENGKARYEIFDREMHAYVLNLLQIESDLRRALECDEFVLHYQPIVELSTQRLAGFEALVRWQHPDKGLIYPDQFISVAEDTGLIMKLGERVLERACQQICDWQRRFSVARSLTISINLASKQFQEANFIGHLDQVLQRTGVKGACLELEITESILMENTDAVNTRLLQLQERGVRLSIDDFGTGYSSLGYLQQFPINTLKIDRSFVGQLSDHSDPAIVRAIVTLAHTLGMSVIAEGIETETQFRQLRQFQTEYGQGYYFAKPMDQESASALIASDGRGLVEVGE